MATSPSRRAADEQCQQPRDGHRLAAGPPGGPPAARRRGRRRRCRRSRQSPAVPGRSGGPWTSSGAAHHGHPHVGDAARRTACCRTSSSASAPPVAIVTASPASSMISARFSAKRAVVVDHQVAAHGAHCAVGSRTTKRAPPSRLRIDDDGPPWRSTIRRTSASPSPMPLTLVVIERLEQPLADRPGRCLGPVSSTASCDRGRPRRRTRDAHSPPAGDAAWTAFSTRFTKTWRSCPASPTIAGARRPPPREIVTSGTRCTDPDRRRRSARARRDARVSGRSRIMSSRSVMMSLAIASCSAMRSTCFWPRSSSVDPRLQDEERRLDDAQRVAKLVADGADELPEGGEPLVPRAAARADPRGRCAA